MKKLFSIIAVAVCVVLSSFSVSAQENLTTCLLVHLQDGGIDRFNLPDEPVVTIENHKMTVTSAALAHEYDFEQVSHFSFTKDDPSAVDKITEEKAFSLSFTDNNHVIISATDLQWAAAYNMGGLEVARANASDDTATLDLSNAAPGVYVIATSCHPAVKIIKR